jgi:recombinational DNA repair protein (RecF pathway)
MSQRSPFGQIEGIIVYKNIQKNRDLMVKMLTRSGELATLYCYGGQGGGKKQAGSSLELGSMIRAEIKIPKTYTQSDLAHTSVWSVIWQGDLIRRTFEVYYQMCLAFEIILKISPQLLWEDCFENQKNALVSNQDLFLYLSNFLFYLDKNLKEIEYKNLDFLILFFLKILRHMGLLPLGQTCTRCQCDLSSVPSFLSNPEGGFMCLVCLESSEEKFFDVRKVHDHHHLKNLVNNVEQLSFKSSPQLHGNIKMLKIVFEYFCHHLSLSPYDFKSMEFIAE